MFINIDFTNFFKNLPTFEQYWKNRAHSNTLTREDFIVRAIIKAIKAKNKSGQNREDIAVGLLKRYFTPVSNEKKLANGRQPYDSIRWGLNDVKWSLASNKLHQTFKLETIEWNEFKEILNLVGAK